MEDHKQEELRIGGIRENNNISSPPPLQEDQGNHLQLTEWVRVIKCYRESSVKRFVTVFIVALTKIMLGGILI
jgi:hypothetical protein